MAYNEQTERIGSIAGIKINADPYERIRAYQNNSFTLKAPSEREIAISQQIKNTDPYMAKSAIFAFGTDGLNMIGPSGTNICQNQYDDFGNIRERSFSIIA